MNVSVSIAELVDVSIEDDAGYSPDLADDLCKRAADTAIRLYREVGEVVGVDMDKPE